MVHDIHDISIFIKAMFVFMFYQTKFTSTCLLKSMQSAAGNQTFNFIPYPLCKPLVVGKSEFAVYHVSNLNAQI